MKRYIKSNYEIPYFGSADYPAYLLYNPKYDTSTLYKYKQEYLHDIDRYMKQEGMYYTLSEVSEDGGKTFRPLTDSEKSYEVITSMLDVYPNGEVGFIWDGRYNHFGYIDGNQIIKGK